ncbi:MAG: hypothetical protein QNJ84_11060 [Alphaproteobacteria bacterium]|nr:hypothetical protein [Alphaproteobacteria bacterium]
MTFAAAILAYAALLWTDTPLKAAPALYRGVDADDGSALSGFRIDSRGGGGFLFFVCDTDKTTPQILFAHGQALGKPADPIRFIYAIDDGPRRANWMLVRQGVRSAAFFVRYPDEYFARFGEQPPSFVAGENAVNPSYLAWDRSVYLQLVADFAAGEEALVDIVDATETRYRYRFALNGVAEALEALSACYQTPSPAPGT